MHCLWVALAVFALGIGPFFIFAGLTNKLVTTACLTGLGLTSVLSYPVSRKFGMPAVCGAVGATLCIGVFLMLLLVFVGPAAKDNGEAVDPISSGAVMGISLFWVALVFAISLLGLKHGERKEQNKAS